MPSICGDDPNALPLALIGFHDKTNTDVHGSLSCVPFIVTPTFLNIECRNDCADYMVLEYIPNLGLGKGTKQAVSSTMKVQDKHNCLCLITEQIKKIHQCQYRFSGKPISTYMSSTLARLCGEWRNGRTGVLA
jgi:hypothetical protein